jgi:hypothetical protein
VRGRVEHLVVTSALAVAALNALAAAIGGVRWWRSEDGRPFWPALRLAQTAAVLFAAGAGIASLEGHSPDDGLFWLYALLPLAVGFVGEQLRGASAQTVLDARGLADARAMSALDEGEQREIVLAILRREMGVMACAAAVTVFLALRAASTAGGF